MSAEDLKFRKTWQDIAERVRREHDPRKLTRLAQTLILALDDQARRYRAEQKTMRSGEHERGRAA